MGRDYNENVFGVHIPSILHGVLVQSVQYKALIFYAELLNFHNSNTEILSLHSILPFQLLEHTRNAAEELHFALDFHNSNTEILLRNLFACIFCNQQNNS
jgi:hypothetical protein